MTPKRSRKPKPSRKLPAEPLSREEIERLIGACSRRGACGVRNAALIGTCYRAGLRLGEALALRPRDVDLETGVVRVLHGKGDRARTVAVDSWALALLSRWSDRRKALRLGPHAPLFATLQGGEIAQPYIRALLPRLARRAGIDRRVHCHGLRHSFAAELVSEGLPVTTIRDALGHSTIAVTDRYLRAVNPKAVTDALRHRGDAPADPIAALEERLVELQAEISALRGKGRGR
jgi:site-specific recombinase XerD